MCSLETEPVYDSAQSPRRSSSSDCVSAVVGLGVSSGSDCVFGSGSDCASAVVVTVCSTVVVTVWQ